MITIHNDLPVEVGMNGTGLLFTNTGEWILPHANYIMASGQTGQVAVAALHSGAVITVDSGGRVTMVDGPALGTYAIYGFSTVILVMGFFLFIRWNYRTFMRTARVPTSIE